MLEKGRREGGRGEEEMRKRGEEREERGSATQPQGTAAGVREVEAHLLGHPASA